MAKRIFLLVCLAVLALIAWVMLWRDEGASILLTDAGVATPAPSTVAPPGAAPGAPRARVNRVAEEVLVAESLHEAILNHAARRGGDDRQVRSLYFQAKDVCWTQVEATQLRRRRPEGVADPLRDWAVDELQRRCEGFPENIAAIESTSVP